MRALILGVTGQDGLILASKLHSCPNLRVFGTTRRSINNLDRQLGFPLSKFITCIQLDPEQKNDVFSLIEQVQPDQIFVLAGQSSVGLSFADPHQTISSGANILLNVLEGVRLKAPKCRVFNAVSSECFGETLDYVATEDTKLNPQSPYAVSKSISSQIAKGYRDQFGIFVSNGILFNHESSLRGENFVIKKIMRAVLDLKSGNAEPVGFGKLDIKRDWGFAPEFVEAMTRCLIIDEPQDFIIATGKLGMLSDLINNCFSFYDLNWNEKIYFDKALSRKNEPLVVAGNPKKAFSVLSWKATTDIDNLPEKLFSKLHLFSG